MSCSALRSPRLEAPILVGLGGVDTSGSCQKPFLPTETECLRQ